MSRYRINPNDNREVQVKRSGVWVRKSLAPTHQRALTYLAALKRVEGDETKAEKETIKAEEEAEKKAEEKAEEKAEKKAGKSGE